MSLTIDSCSGSPIAESASARLVELWSVPRQVGGDQAWALRRVGRSGEALLLRAYMPGPLPNNLDSVRLRVSWLQREKKNQYFYYYL